VKANDPKTLREMSQPFTPEDANSAVGAFCEELYELRVKHKIREVYAIIVVPVVYPADEHGPESETDVFASMHCGSRLMRQPMAQWAAGFEAARANEMASKARAEGERAARKPNQ